MSTANILQSNIVYFQVDESQLKHLKLKKDIEDLKKLRKLQIEKKNIKKYLYHQKDYLYDILEIDLRGCLVGNQGLSILENSFKIHDLSKLKINLSQNNLNTNAAKLLAKVIVNFKNMTQLSLKLNNCNIGTEQSENISKQISEKFSDINNLSLKFNSDCLINSYEAKTFANIVKCYKSIKQLTAYYSNEKNDQTVKNIKNQINGIKSLRFCIKRSDHSIIAFLEVLNALKNCQQFTHLNLKLDKNSIYDDGANFIANAIQNLKKLAFVSLGFRECHITQNGIKSLISSLKDKNQIIQLNLDFSQNSLNADAAKLLAKVIANYKNMTQLSLKLKRNSIGFEGAQSIADSIESSSKITSLRLNLSDCNIGTEQSEDISKLISEKLSGINHLFLNFNDDIQISSNEAKDFANIIKNQKNIKQLTVDFGKNKNSVNACLEVFNEVQICEQFTHLYINLDKNNIKDDGANFIADAIQNLIKLTFVNLGFRDCHIAVNGIKSLANSLKDKKDIVQLNLDFGEKYFNKAYYLNEDAVQCISNTLQNLEKLTHVNLSLQCRYIKQQGAECLSNALKEKKNIKHLVLNLDGNKISEQTKEDLKKKLKELNPSFDIDF
ncbi:hypothetical protein ABPG73_004498 [Tetrahymena malaccensis]